MYYIEPKPRYDVTRTYSKYPCYRLQSNTLIDGSVLFCITIIDLISIVNDLVQVIRIVTIRTTNPQKQ